MAIRQAIRVLVSPTLRSQPRLEPQTAVQSAFHPALMLLMLASFQHVNKVFVRALLLNQVMSSLFSKRLKVAG